MLNVRGFLHRGMLISMPALLAICACDDNPEAPDAGVEMVTIAGTVFNIDLGVPAEGILVRLLDTSHADVAATGSDGRFELQVPKGSELILSTDDPDGATDNWIQLINVDVPLMVANENILDWLTHACPQTSGGTYGSVAIWDRYLAEADDSNGDCFEPLRQADAPGGLTVVFAGCESGAFTLHADMSLEITDPACPVGYVDATKKHPANMDATQGPEMFYPCTQDRTDDSGWALSFCDTTFTGSTVTVTFTDLDLGRNLAFETPITVPVRPGAMTLMFGLTIDGVTNQNIRDVFACIAP